MSMKKFKALTFQLKLRFYDDYFSYIKHFTCLIERVKLIKILFTKQSNSTEFFLSF